jgi:hypothetical protein
MNNIAANPASLLLTTLFIRKYAGTVDNTKKVTPIFTPKETSPKSSEGIDIKMNARGGSPCGLAVLL